MSTDAEGNVTDTITYVLTKYFIEVSTRPDKKSRYEIYNVTKYKDYAIEMLLKLRKEQPSHRSRIREVSTEHTTTEYKKTVRTERKLKDEVIISSLKSKDVILTEFPESANV